MASPATPPPPPPPPPSSSSTANKCAYCDFELDTVRYITCTECPSFEMCLVCFSNGAEIGDHRKEHPYRIIPQTPPATTKIAHVFETSKPWSIAEETMLLDAVEQYGFGNWEDVANHVKSRTTAECQDHFVTFYIHGNVGAVCFPDDSSRSNYKPIADSTPPVRNVRTGPGGGTGGGGPNNNSNNNTNNNEAGSGNDGDNNTNTGLTNGTTSSSTSTGTTTTTSPAVDLSASEQKDLGYMMFRGDFEREFDNEAENVISSLAINYDDEEMDILFKLSQVDRYRYRLSDREQRKVLAREFGLLSSATIFTSSTGGGKPKSQQTKKTKSSSSGSSSSSSSKDDKEIVEKLRVFARFLSSKDHKQYCDNLQREKDLRNQIKELSRYRRNGLTKTDEVDAFEDHKNKKERRADRCKKSSNSSSSTTTNKRTTSSSLASSAAAAAAANSKKNEGKTEQHNDDNDDSNMDDEENDKDMSSLPNFEQLSSSEKKLCSNLRLTPSNYITIKTCIIKDYLQRQQGHPVKIRYPSYLDKTHRRKIISFLSNNGWICVT